MNRVRLLHKSAYETVSNRRFGDVKAADIEVGFTSADNATRARLRLEEADSLLPGFHSRPWWAAGYIAVDLGPPAPGPSGIHIRYQFALELVDHVFEHQLLFFQTPYPQLIGMGNVDKLCDGDIEIAMCHAQLFESSMVTKSVSNYVVHIVPR